MKHHVVFIYLLGTCSHVMTIYVALKDTAGNQEACFGLTWKELLPS